MAWRCPSPLWEFANSSRLHLGATSALLIGGAENSVVLPSVGLNGESESYWLVVLGSQPS